MSNNMEYQHSVWRIKND